VRRYNSARSDYRPGCYTLPSGRSASKREYDERMRLLEARDKCPECNKLAEMAVFDFNMSCQCPAHRSYGR
jgi:hypothetical protein